MFTFSTAWQHHQPGHVWEQEPRASLWWQFNTLKRELLQQPSIWKIREKKKFLLELESTLFRHLRPNKRKTTHKNLWLHSNHEGDITTGDVQLKLLEHLLVVLHKTGTATVDGLYWCGYMMEKQCWNTQARYNIPARKYFSGSLCDNTILVPDKLQSLAAKLLLNVSVKQLFYTFI